MYRTNPGAREIYVRTFPDPNGGKWKISNKGGVQPVWSREGGELFYRQGNKMMVMAVKSELKFIPTSPLALFERNFYMGPALNPQYDISRDGQRFLMLESLQRSESAEIYVVLNWFEELKRLVPVGQ